jgi:transposase InsO family protein
MTGRSDVTPRRERWAQFRFSVVGPLLASPPKKGELRAETGRLAAKTWVHPITGEPTRFGRSTIQRWYYQAKRARRDPVTALARAVRTDSGATRIMKQPLKELAIAQHREHPGWSYTLRYKNLQVLAKAKPALGPLPSYRSFLRFMRANGLIKRKRKGRAGSPGARRAEHRFEHREVRSYESEYVNALWHYDFHHSSVRVGLATGQWAYPVLCGILDDHSRLCCHAQWYLAETAENLIHTLTQAYLKRGLPRADLSDNGAAMTAHETTEGLTRLGIVHDTTLPYTPNQNGKQESFWSTLEGSLVAMLEVATGLTVAKLNEATQAWIEMGYNRTVHSSIGCTPLERFLNDLDVSRPSPPLEELRVAFTRSEVRKQRRTDGTIALKSVRFEVPSRYGHVKDIHVRYASWDLTHAYVCDPTTGAVLATVRPQDKRRNAEGARAVRETHLGAAHESTPDDHEPKGIAPLLKELMSDYAATGLPAAYLPKDDLDYDQTEGTA